MKKMNLLQVFVVVLAGTTLMSAQASRTWVSGVGDDANPCSRTAPCKTFAGAISKTAPGGEIDALDPGGFGAVTITKSITIDGGGGQVASVLVSGTNGIVVQANGSTDVVILRNLRINGIGSGINGIRFNSGKELHIENCSIFGFTTSGIDLEPTNAAKVFVDNTTSNDNAFAGMTVQSSFLTQVDVFQSRFQSNGIHGIFAGSNSNVSVTLSDASGNAGEGFLAAPNSGTAELNLTSSSANNNGTGVLSGGTAFPATVRVAAVSLNHNTTGFATSTNGVIRSFGNNFNSGTGTPTAGQGIPQQ